MCSKDLPNLFGNTCAFSNSFAVNLYVVTVAARARPALDQVVGTVEADCGIASNLGKTRVLGAAEAGPPPGLEQLGVDVWRGNRPTHERGMVVLGSPVGHPDFVQAWAVARMAEEREFLQHLPQLPDLQCAWLLLALCASPRANHALRTIPPPDVAAYAAAHDEAVWGTLRECLGGDGGEDADEQFARDLACLPASLGGLGLASAAHVAPAAYWAAWADALPVMAARLPAFAAACVAALQQGGAGAACLSHAASARTLLMTEGWDACPSWTAVAGGLRPDAEADTGLGEWPHGWQLHASRTRNSYYRDRVMLPSLTPDRRALLRSQSGPHSGAWLTAIPGEPATTLFPPVMQVALRRRLRLPLPITARHCGSPGCGGSTRRHLGSRPTIRAAWISSSTAPPHWVSPYVAMPPSCPR